MVDKIDYTGEGVVTERLVTLFEPNILDGKIEIGTATLTYDKTVAEPYITIEELKAGPCYLINFDIPKNKNEFKITIK